MASIAAGYSERYSSDHPARGCYTRL